MRWPFLSPRSAPSPAPDLTAVAALAYGEGMRVGTDAERARCATILRSPIADHNTASAEMLAFGSDMDASAAVLLLMQLANTSEADRRAGPDAAHYVQAAQTINTKKAAP